MRLATVESDERSLSDRDIHIRMIKVGIVVRVEGDKANLIVDDHQMAIVILAVLMIVRGVTEEGCLYLVPSRWLH